jgi:formylglycine-generating enzyme required for sulfatase activity
MKRIEGARFVMGSAAEGETPSNESPEHEVSLQAFCLDVTEVTVRDYERCAGCPKLLRTARGDEMTPNGITFYSAFCNGPDSEDHPVNCIDWHAASAYCEAAGKRLPTESEWELAARGTDQRIYPWGNTAPSSQRVNACGAECQQSLLDRRKRLGYGPEPARLYEDADGAPTTAPVGHFAAGATPSGVHDLAGNVWEWTSSPACRYGQPDCGESNRVIRGGGWDTVESRDLRAARRRPSAPSARSWSIGFRCAKSS